MKLYYNLLQIINILLLFRNLSKKIVAKFKEEYINNFLLLAHIFWKRFLVAFTMYYRFSLPGKSAFESYQIPTVADMRSKDKRGFGASIGLHAGN